ncbi:hypothetical protein [Chromobacterium haemolyticum]|uniref:hypothetical protein n=1 Tax=Chromobacterium haemolyticum TaxID=394935 RepID=UPI0011780572|nr:hypothetical protein [Chromobacterium haemolyticum]
MTQIHPLPNVVDVCEKLVIRARESFGSTYRIIYGHGLFVKAVRHGRSILTLTKEEDEQDIGGMCFLARCIMEAYKAASYFLEAGLSANEADMRLQLFSLNHSTDLCKIHERLGISKSDSLHHMTREWSLKKLEHNPIFMSLDEKHKNNLRRGKSPYQHNRYAGKNLLPSDVESGLYTLFSHSAHSFSLSLPETGSGSASASGAANSFFLAADVASIHLAAFGLLYWRVRHRAIKYLSPKERTILKESSSPSHLIERLEKIRSRYSEW